MTVLHTIMGLGILLACTKDLPEPPQNFIPSNEIYKLNIQNSQLIDKISIQELMLTNEVPSQKFEGHLHGEFDYLENAAIDFCASSRNGHTEGEGFYYSKEFSCNFKSMCIHQEGNRKVIISMIQEVFDFQNENEYLVRDGDLLVFMFLNENGSSYPDGINQHFFLIPASEMSGMEKHALILQTSHWSKDWEF